MENLYNSDDYPSYSMGVNSYMAYFFVDCEADMKSPCPNLGAGMTEFGAVEYNTRATFYGAPFLVRIDKATFDYSHQDIVQIRERAIQDGRDPNVQQWYDVMVAFKAWVSQFGPNPIFWSDNPAYDWQWINYHFWHTIGNNPFGHSARRIGDYYAGLVGDIRASSKWKRFRVTKHDHNPVNDAMGNCEAFTRILKGEKV